MSIEGAIVKSPPRALTRPSRDVSPEEARAELAKARERVVGQLARLEKSMGKAARWREVVRKHPFLTLGGAFLVGFGLARLFSRR